MSLLSPWGICETALNIHACTALQKLSITGFAFELAFIDHDLAAREHGLDHALDLLAFVSVVIAVHVLCLDAERLFLVRIEDHDVSIRTDSDRSFLWKQAKHLCGRG